MKRCAVYFAVFFALFLAWLALPASAQEITGGQNMTGLADQLLSSDKSIRQAASEELGRQQGLTGNRLLSNFDALNKHQGPDLHTFNGPFALTIGQLGRWRDEEAAGRLVDIIDFTLDPATLPPGGGFGGPAVYYPAVGALEEIGGETVTSSLLHRLTLPCSDVRLRASAEVLRKVLGQENAKVIVEHKLTGLQVVLKRLDLSSITEQENLKAIEHLLDEKGGLLNYPPRRNLDAFLRSEFGKGFVAGVDNDSYELVQGSMSIHAMRGVADLDFDQVARETNLPWIVARVTPGLLSGGLSPAEDFKTADAGKPAYVPNAESPVWTMIEGKIKVDAVLSGKLRTRPTSYVWGSQGIFVNNDPELELVLPFMGASQVLVCQFNEQQRGDYRFAPHFVIPPEWESFVRPAVRFYRNNAALMRPPATKGHTFPTERLTKLERLLTDKNPFLAVAAWRLLLVSGGLDAGIARRTLAHSHGFRQAIFTHLLLDCATAVELPPLTQAVVSVVNGSHVTSAILGIGLGSFFVSERQNDIVPAPYKVITQALIRRQRTSPTDTDADRTLNFMLGNTP